MLASEQGGPKARLRVCELKAKLVHLLHSHGTAALGQVGSAGIGVGFQSARLFARHLASLDAGGEPLIPILNRSTWP